MFKFQENRPCRYGIMTKYNTDVNKIKWFDVPSHYVFHYVNAWEDQNEANETVVTMFAIVWDKIRIELQESEHFWSSTDKNHLKKFTFNLSTGKFDIKTLLTNQLLEFPIINQYFMGYKNRYTYIALSNPETLKNQVNYDD